MAIRKEEEKKVGMKITDNMDGEKRADEKLEAKYKPGISSRELNKLPGSTIQEKIEKKLGYSRALKNPGIMSSKGKEMGIKILKDILSVNKQR